MRYVVEANLEHAVVKATFTTKEHAKNFALYLIESDGWRSDRWYSPQPEDGMSWTQPDGKTGLVLLLPEREDIIRA
jgi:hypothetical protein